MALERDDLLGVDLGGRYRLEALAAEEMLGRVYAARDLRTGRLVHLKVLHPQLAGDAEKFARFGRELTATRMVRHPNTVSILDWGQAGPELPFLVLEYLATHTLEDELARGPLRPERAAAIAAQVAAAIGAAHQEGIVHRNLGPTNILLLDNVPGSAVFAKVRDFGLSKLEKYGEESTTLTQAGARIGNVHAMAPEYIEDDRVHPKGDLYALGVVLFQMLTGRTPFEGKAVEVLTKHVTEEPPRPSAVRPGLPPWCDEVVARLLAKKPDDRPGAYQVVQALEDAVGHPIAPPPLLGIDADGAVVRPSRLPYVVAIAGAVFLTLGAGLLTLTVGVAVVVLVVLRGPSLVARDEPVDLAPLPGATIPVAPLPAPVAAAPAPRPAARPVPAVAPPAPAPVATVRVRANRRVLVYVDGMALGYTPLDVPVAPGPHAVAALVPGQAATRQEQQVDVGRAAAPTVEFQF